MRQVYLLYYWLFFVPVFLLLTVLTALVTIVGCLLGGERWFAYYPGMLWSRATCVLSLCRVKVCGREHIRRDGSYVFVANHQGAFDIFLMYGYLGVPVKWVMKSELRRLPLVGAACKAAGFIYTDKATQASGGSIAAAERALRRGASVAIFPEGSRTLTGRMGRFRKGAFVMATDAHLPVVPVTLNGCFNVLPYGKIIVKPHRMEMIIHPPVATDGIEMAQLVARTREIICSALWEEYLPCER